MFLLGYSLVWSKAMVFEIMITGSNPVTSAKFKDSYSKPKANYGCLATKPILLYYDAIDYRSGQQVFIL